MKNFRILQRISVAIACLGLLLPGQLFAAAPVDSARPTTQLSDISLHEGGVFAGQIVGENGNPLAAVPVSLKYQGSEIAHVTTDANGAFAVRGVRTGVYTVHASDAVGCYRAWNGATAPPSAKPGALLVSHKEIVRGQGCDCGATTASDCTCGNTLGCGGLPGFLTNPIVIGAVVATAIAVPLAISENGSGS
jgi:hypothetical protein